MSIQTDAKRFDKSNLISIDTSNLVATNDDDEYYRLDYDKAGIALIFTQKVFRDESLKIRHGADKDQANLMSILRRYGYDVRAFVDLTKEQIEDTLKDVSRENHSDNSSLIVVMMSHGGKDANNEGIIYTFDGQMKVDSLWRYFAGDRCSSLVGKPKLFFIQACRGALCDFGAILEKEEEVEKRCNQNEEATCSQHSTPQQTQRIPIMADILVMFSSADMHVSYRDHNNGSWFIEALCKRLEQYINSSHDNDLISILTSVNRYVAYSKEAVDNGFRFKQMPVIMSMLTRTFHFNRNYMIKENNEST